MIRKIHNNEFSLITFYLKKLNPLFDEEYMRRNPYARYYVLIYNKEIVGILGYTKIYERMEIEYIYILEPYRGLGFSKELMDFLIEKAIMQKIENITLEVNVNNKVAIHLYELYGFKIASIRKNYYKNDDGYLMFRKL